MTEVTDAVKNESITEKTVNLKSSISRLGSQILSNDTQ